MRDGLPSSVELGARLREVEDEGRGARRGDGDEWLTGCDELCECDGLCECDEDCDDDRACECDVEGASEPDTGGSPLGNSAGLLPPFTPDPFSLDAVLVGVAM